MIPDGTNSLISIGNDVTFTQCFSSGILRVGAAMLCLEDAGIISSRQVDPNNNARPHKAGVTGSCIWGLGQPASIS
jgi:hypothetical protein